MKTNSGFSSPAKILAVTFGLCWPLIGANLQTENKTDSAPESLDSQFRVLEKEYRTAADDFSKRYSAAKTDEDRQEIAKSYPQPQRYLPRFMALADAHPDSPAAVDALVWVVQNGRVGPEADRALKTLHEKHLVSAKLGPVCQSLIYSRNSDTESFLRDLMSRNPNHDVQGLACFSLALVRERSSPSDAEKLFQQTIEQYGDVASYMDKKLGDLAKANLFEMHELGTGKLAPDIEGEDVDGNRFKLSDYRGKVVVIDFWGDW